MRPKDAEEINNSKADAKQWHTTTGQPFHSRAGGGDCICEYIRGSGMGALVEIAVTMTGPQVIREHRERRERHELESVPNPPFCCFLLPPAPKKNLNK
ncbi:hypothetical protein VTJ04DRAFT_2516 [Mycothermus thermophilus]|uniref:uncharacterized protein n=1 Tax=Humicola insolens TaxID=85995 RepID=UPI00374443EA